MAKSSTVDQLERAFAVVIAQARKDEDFARQLLDALTPPIEPKTKPKKAAPKTSKGSAKKTGTAKTNGAKTPSAKAPTSAIAESVEDIRNRLRPLTRNQIYALIQAQKIAPTGTSKYNKHQLIEHVVRNQSGTAKRTFDY